MKTVLPELLVPAGSLMKLKMALAYGADAVYVGAAGFSMRPDSASIGASGLVEAVNFTHEMNKKIYIAVNTLMFERESASFEQWIDETQGIPFDAIIVGDVGVLSLIKEKRPNLPVHISTQMSTTNSHAARFLKQAGAERIILARECTFEDLEGITKSGVIDLEVFIHGAMCMAVSGRCLLSAYLCGSSANKGQCKHTCRWEWQLVEEKRPGEIVPVYETGKETVFLGSKDLCLIDHLPFLVRSGVKGLKIEGRMKSEYYVANVTRVYRAALDACAESLDDFDVEPLWESELASLSHRPYTTGFAFGYPFKEPQSMQTHNRPVGKGEPVAYVYNEKYGRHKVEVKNPFTQGESLQWIGPQMAGGALTVKKIWDLEGDPIERTISGSFVTVEFEGKETHLPELSILRRMQNRGKRY